MATKTMDLSAEQYGDYSGFGDYLENDSILCEHSHPAATYPIVISFGFAYGIVGVLGLVGNIIVLLTVAAKREIQSVTNGIICHLAFADIVLCLTSLWMTPSVILSPNHRWLFGKVLCYVKQITSALSFHVSAYTLVLIAVDRYLMIVHAFKRYRRTACCVLSIFLIWSAAICMALPYALKTVYVEPMPELCPHIVFCQDSQWTKNERIGYGISIFLFKSVIPFAVIAFCYIRIRAKLQLMDHQMKGRKHSCRDRLPGEPTEVERKRALHRILIAMVIVFGVSTIPLDLIGLISDIDWYHSVISLKVKPFLTLAAHFAAITATLWNPLLYAWWNTSFKKEIVDRLSAFRSKSNILQSITWMMNSANKVTGAAGHGGDSLISKEMELKRRSLSMNTTNIDHSQMERLLNRRSTGQTILPALTLGTRSSISSNQNLNTVIYRPPSLVYTEKQGRSVAEACLAKENGWTNKNASISMIKLQKIESNTGTNTEESTKTDEKNDIIHDLRCDNYEPSDELEYKKSAELSPPTKLTDSAVAAKTPGHLINIPTAALANNTPIGGSLLDISPTDSKNNISYDSKSEGFSCTESNKEDSEYPEKSEGLEPSKKSPSTVTPLLINIDSVESLNRRPTGSRFNSFEDDETDEVCSAIDWQGSVLSLRTPGALSDSVGTINPETAIDLPTWSPRVKKISGNREPTFSCEQDVFL